MQTPTTLPLQPTQSLDSTGIEPPGGEHAGGLRIVQWSPGMLAWDGQMVWFALQLGGAWLAGTLAIGGLASALEDPESSRGAGVFWALVAPWSFAFVQFFVAGVARMVSARVQDHHPTPSRAAWAFLLRHGFGVLLGSVAPGLVVSGVLVGFMLIVRGLSAASESGLVGAVLTVPVFFVLLVLLPLLWHCQFVPIVMGVENCGVISAVRRLAVRSPFEALNSLIEIARATLPKIWGSLLMVFVVMLITFLVTLPEYSWDALWRPGLAGLVSNLSYGLILCLWVAYSATTVAVAFAEQYYSQSGT